MKKFIYICLAFILFLSVVITKNTMQVQLKDKVQETPKGSDLQNHFGTTKLSGIDPRMDIAYDKFVESNPEVFVPQRYTNTTGGLNLRKQLDFRPYYGYEDKLNPHQMKSGDFTNIAPSATKVISPEVTVPKLHVQSELNYPAQTSVPNFYGYKKEYVPAYMYDKLEGRIVQENVLMNRPHYGYQDQARQ